MLKKIFLSLLAVLVIVVIWNWSLIVYGVRMGVGQLDIVWNAKPVEYYMNDTQFPDSLKSKLKLIEEVRRFAIDSLGLKDTENYKTLYDQKGEELMWVVQACEPFSLEPIQWKFPVVGSVPYKGFFDKNKALNERKVLEEEGLDVSVRNPGGWSTLGWFTDPILSGMLQRSDGDLAELILHEMVHATIFVKDSIDFNENLATFIGDTAAYYFLDYKYGKSADPFQSYVRDVQDYRKYFRHILRGTQSLDSLYGTMKPEDAVEVKKQKKKEMIQRIMDTADTLNLSQPRNKGYKNRLPNNTYFMSYRLYHAKQVDFKEEFDRRYRGNLKEYIRYLSEKYPYL
jgi:Predicted aminopeptidase